MKLETRVWQLKRKIEAAHGAGHLFYAAIICNRCGTIVQAPDVETLAERTVGWRVGEFGEDADYCPECR